MSDLTLQSPKRQRGGPRDLPWVDASGNVHLPAFYRNTSQLTPRQLGALTSVCTRRGGAAGKIRFDEAM